MSPDTPTLLDEESGPPLRAVIGRLLASCTYADIAVGHLRLAAIDLEPDALSRLHTCRVVLDRIEARSLEHFGNAAALRDMIASDRVEMRSVGYGAWTPDFSLFRGDEDAGDTLLIGAHYFREPVVHHGPSFTCVIRDPTAIATARRRFDELWDRAHDVRIVVAAALGPP